MSDFHPQFFGGNIHAAKLVDDLCWVAHVWDDLIDQEEVEQERIHLAFERCLLSIPSNSFYLQHQAQLLPLLHTGILSWYAANAMEKSGDAHQLEIAHGLRYAVGQVVTYCVSMTMPREQVVSTLQEAWKVFMPERLSDYQKEHHVCA